MGLEGVASFVSNNLLDEGQTERLVFRKFRGDKLLESAITGDPIKSQYVDTVMLSINPQEISYTSQKIINKVPANAPGRFVVFDWGNDLTLLNIVGVTGNLLPDVASGKIDPLSPVRGVLDTIAAGSSAFGHPEKNTTTTRGNTLTAVSTFTKDLVTSQMSYFDILKMSKKYRTFQRLQKLYDMFDADKDVVTLEMGDTVYRGYFTEFRFSVTKDSPWNWSYTVGFVILNDLTDKTRRNDDMYPTDDNIISQDD